VSILGTEVGRGEKIAKGINLDETGRLQSSGGGARNCVVHEILDKGSRERVGIAGQKSGRSIEVGLPRKTQ